MRDQLRSRLRRCLAHAGLLVSLSLTSSFAAETGSVCVRDYTPGRTCSGSDVAITALEPVTILEDCASGDPGTAEAVFDLWVSAGGSSCYDIGLFLALDGGSALSGGNCLHDYLEPPLATSPTYGDADGDGVPDILHGPWWNAEPFDPVDDCGDIAAGTDSIKTLISFRFACADSTLDGIVDVSTCTSWRAGTQDHCGGLSDAIASSDQRCGCQVVETGIPMAGAAGPSGRVAGLTVDRAGGGELLLSWTSSCSANDTDFEVYEGTLGDFSSHHSVVCTTGGMTSAAIQPASQASYYLVVPRNSQREGSYGSDSAGFERPPATTSCVPQLVQDPCL